MDKHTYLEFLYSRLSTKKLLSVSCREYLSSIAHLEHWEKNQSLQMKGHAVKKIWFVAEGCLRTRFYHERKTDFITLTFWFPGQWAGVFTHLFSGSKSDRVIEAIEDSSVLSFSYVDLLEFCLRFPDEWQAIAGSMIEGHLRDFDLLHIDVLLLSARERYKKLLSSHPEIFQMINQKEIASFLNISREELSRMRAEKT